MNYDFCSRRYEIAEKIAELSKLFVEKVTGGKTLSPPANQIMLDL